MRKKTSTVGRDCVDYAFDWLYEAAGESEYFGDVHGGQQLKLGAHRVPQALLEKLRNEKKDALAVVREERRKREKLTEHVAEVKTW